ncbi:uncharacterized protein METZ01_LOCUS271007, partial [marine metagenome]
MATFLHDSLHRSKPPVEFVHRLAKSILGHNGQETSHIHQCKQQIAKLFDHMILR